MFMLLSFDCIFLSITLKLQVERLKTFGNGSKISKNGDVIYDIYSNTE